MRITVLGAGGVGGYFGGKLAQAGEDVAFVARGEHLRAVQLSGLRVRSPADDFTISVPAADDPAVFGTPDLVLFCVKSYDTEHGIEQIRPVVGPDTAVLTLQNGVQNGERLAEAFGPEAVMLGAAFIETSVAHPGEIDAPSPRRAVIFGERNGRITPRAEALLAAFQRAEVDATLSDSILTICWEKFLFITAMAGMTTVTRRPIGEVRTYEPTRQMLRGLMEECAAVATAAAVPLSSDIVERTMRMSDNLQPSMKSSMQRDLERGRRLEIDDLNGSVVTLGRRYGVPTPLHFAVSAVVGLENPVRER
jgi:2-dehydropantoate 2-reductase